MISITAEYALRAIVFLARDRQRAWTTQQVAAATHVPLSYLSKVLQALVRAEIIQSVRGIYGGYQLGEPPERFTALQVINSVDPIRRIRHCPLKLAEHKNDLCPLHRRVDDAIALAERAFAETTIAELLAPPDGVGQCSFPRRSRVRRAAGPPRGKPKAPGESGQAAVKRRREGSRP